MQILEVLRRESTAHSGDKNSLSVSWAVFVEYISLVNVVKIQKKNACKCILKISKWMKNMSRTLLFDYGTHPSSKLHREWILAWELSW